MRLTPGQKNSRDKMIASLRTEGHTYDSIAQKIYAAGYTENVINRIGIYRIVKRIAPHLLGNLGKRVAQIIRRD